MRRRLYLLTLPILQAALIFELATPFAHALRVEVAAGTAPAGWPAIVQLVAATAAIVGTAAALAFPALVLARHRRAGLVRFCGLPRGPVTLAFCGGASLAAGYALLALSPALPDEARVVAAFLARPVVVGGLALAAAGVLCAELLRRSTLASTFAAGAQPRGPGRIEVTHPPELATRAA